MRIFEIKTPVDFDIESTKALMAHDDDNIDIEEINKKIIENILSKNKSLEYVYSDENKEFEVIMAKHFSNELDEFKIKLSGSKIISSRLSMLDFENKYMQALTAFGFYKLNTKKVTLNGDF